MSSSWGSRWPEARGEAPPREGRSGAPGGGAALGDLAAERGERRAPVRGPQTRPGRAGVSPRRAGSLRATLGGARTRPEASPRGAALLPAQTAEAGTAVPTPPRPAAGAAMGAAPGPGPAPAPPRPMLARAPASDPGIVGVLPPDAGLSDSQQSGTW